MSLADPATLRTRVEETGLLWGLVGLVALLSLLPIGRLVVEGLAPGGQLSATALGKVMASPATWTATWNSLTTAIGQGKDAAAKMSNGLTTTIRNYINNEIGAGAEADAFFNKHVTG